MKLLYKRVEISSMWNYDMYYLFLQATLQTYQTVSKKFNGQIIVHYRRTNTVIITREGWHVTFVEIKVMASPM